MVKPGLQRPDAAVRRESISTPVSMCGDLPDRSEPRRLKAPDTLAYRLEELGRLNEALAAFEEWRLAIGTSRRYGPLP